MLWSVHVVALVGCSQARPRRELEVTVCVRAVALVGCGSGEYPGVAQGGPGGSSGVPANVVVRWYQRYYLKAIIPMFLVLRLSLLWHGSRRQGREWRTTLRWFARAVSAHGAEGRRRVRGYT